MGNNVLNKINALVILAAGKSSRFGGFPKALCKVNNEIIAQRIINYAIPYYEKIFLVLNEDTFELNKDEIQNCEILPIKTGQGDAHSFLRALIQIKNKEIDSISRISLCWGDSFFISHKPFMELHEFKKNSKDIDPVIVTVSEDLNPYAWFVVENDYIKESHFSNEISIDSGLHDQSLFDFDFEYVIQTLTAYKNRVSICENVGYMDQMKLLKYFEFLFSEKQYTSARICKIESGNVLSFNTKQELEGIVQRVGISHV